MKAVNPNNSLTSQSKDNYYLCQLKIVRQYFFENSASRFMAAVDTQIPIQNICRYVDKLKDSFSIEIVRKDKCRISGEWVEFLSTNPEMFPPENQLNLF